MDQVIGNWKETLVSNHVVHQFEPQARNEHGYVLIYLHGVHQGKLQDKAEFVSQFEKFGLPVIAPVTKRSWWTDKICEEFDSTITAESFIMNHILDYIKDYYSTNVPRIGIFGTSMGGQGALRLAYKYPDTFPVVAGISPAIDYQNWMKQNDDSPLWQMYESAEHARQDTATLHIHPLYWPRNQFFCCCPEDHDWWDSADRLRMKLFSLGVPFEFDLEISGGGHGFNYYRLQAEKVVQFLNDSLDKERRRIV